MTAPEPKAAERICLGCDAKVGEVPNTCADCVGKLCASFSLTGLQAGRSAYIANPRNIAFLKGEKTRNGSSLAPFPAPCAGGCGRKVDAKLEADRSMRMFACLDCSLEVDRRNGGLAVPGLLASYEKLGCLSFVSAYAKEKFRALARERTGGVEEPPAKPRAAPVAPSLLRSEHQLAYLLFRTEFEVSSEIQRCQTDHRVTAARVVEVEKARKPALWAACLSRAKWMVRVAEGKTAEEKAAEEKAAEEKGKP